MSRNCFTLSDEIKRILSVENRVKLCEDLEPHFLEALSTWPDNPITVVSFSLGETLCLAEHPVKKGKVKVWILED